MRKKISKQLRDGYVVAGPEIHKPVRGPPLKLELKANRGEHFFARMCPALTESRHVASAARWQRKQASVERSRRFGRLKGFRSINLCQRFTSFRVSTVKDGILMRS